MSLDSEEGAISGKATMPRVSNWRVPMRASGCNDPGRVFVFWCKLTTGPRCSSVLELGCEGAAGREGCGGWVRPCFTYAARRRFAWVRVRTPVYAYALGVPFERA